MGAEQSAPRGQDEKSSANTQKTCYYEVLGVDRQMPDEEIRRAYKKKALELHPDRNFNDVENATRRFAEVQTAYEILSDPQERAWYDSHRDAILSGDDGVSGSAPTEQPSNHTSANAVFALMSRFNSSVPMDDSPRGFFGILNVFFEQLAAEESASCDWDGVTPREYPPFGRADDDYNAVTKPFYNAWSSFSTKKSFSWRDKYRLSDAPDRRVRRLMEKENKKFRDEGIREFNDAVLSLVAFVRKRDPRYVPNTQSEAERQQVLRNSAAAQAARSRAANQEKIAEYVVPDWAQPQEPLNNEGEFSLSEDESEVEEIECVVCSKTFKSEKQYEAHERSKKHIKAVQQLKRQMKKENANLSLDTLEAPAPAMSPSLPSRSVPKEYVDAGLHEQHDLMEGDREHSPLSSSHGQFEDNNGSGEQGRYSLSSVEDDEYAPRSAVEERIMDDNNSNRKEAKWAESTTNDVDSGTASLADLSLGDEITEKKIGKAKLKKAKKAARQAAEFDSQDSNKCAVCGENFTSRSKLFLHIKDFPEHAVPVPNPKIGKNKKER
ncbi:hypothetical protein QBC35DRAFT_509371 [Podospora australis]|uniref:Uncharacterized protein n=1 Tax=Podospora australis TaxID=1536484 RepID=A0AAN6WIX9_9PEZI|nr:hypothetical protein QBC35DRAFT_509371 [Podospora australis]